MFAPYNQIADIMARATAGLWSGRQGWRAIIWLVVIAFSLQSYIAQTHIHDAATALHETSSGSHDNKSPIGNNPMDCPFCQAVAHGGTFFLSATTPLLLSAAWIELPAPVLSLRATFDAVAHSWKSRAPPKA